MHLAQYYMEFLQSGKRLFSRNSTQKDIKISNFGLFPIGIHVKTLFHVVQIQMSFMFKYFSTTINSPPTTSYDFFSICHQTNF